MYPDKMKLASDGIRPLLDFYRGSSERRHHRTYARTMRSQCIIVHELPIAIMQYNTSQIHFRE